MRRSKVIVCAVALLINLYLPWRVSAQAYTSEVILITGVPENASHSVNPPDDTPITHYDGGRVSSYLLDGEERSDFSSLDVGDQSHRAPIDIVSADVDGDGTAEVAMLTGINRAPETHENYIDLPQVKIRNADGSVRPNSVFGVSDVTGPLVPIAIAAGDVDFDDRDEIIVLTGKNSSPGTNHNAVVNPHVYIFEADGTSVPNTGFGISAFGQDLAPTPRPPRPPVSQFRWWLGRGRRQRPCRLQHRRRVQSLRYRAGPGNIHA